jgi:hypothetical protein
LFESLQKFGHEVTLQGAPSQDADVNHFMSYNFVVPASGVTTAFVTHIDDVFKMSHLRKIQVQCQINSLICLSSYTRDRLIENGLDPSGIAFVLPAVDVLPERKKIRIGMSGRVYPDGRKNEKWLSHVSSMVDMQHFEFHFFGSGWETTASNLESANAEVVIHQETESFEGDHNKILSTLSTLDYWMYLGFDEGSMGCLDASLAGVPLITTPQGFHLNLPLGIRMPVQNKRELLKVIKNLSSNIHLSERTALYWTWDRYAAEHINIWEGRYSFQGEPPANLALNQIYQPSRLNFLLESFNFVRIRSAFARSKFGIVLRKYIKK